MLSEDLFYFQRLIEKKFNVYSKVEFTAKESVAVIEHIQRLVEEAVALENAAIKSSVKDVPLKASGNVVLLDFQRQKKG